MSKKFFETKVKSGKDMSFLIESDRQKKEMILRCEIKSLKRNANSPQEQRKSRSLKIENEISLKNKFITY